MIKPTIKIVSGFLISAGFIYLIAQKVDVEKAWHVFTGADLAFLPAALLCLAGYVVGLAIRLKTVCFGLKNIPKLSQLISVVLMGFMGNSLFPARMGGLLKVYVLKKKWDVRKSSTAAVLSVEVLLDGLANLIILNSVVWWAIPKVDQELGVSLGQIQKASFIILMVYLLLLTILVSIRSRVLWISRMRLFRSRERLQNTLHFMRGLSIMHSPVKALQALAVSVLAWGCLGLMIFFCFQMAHLKLPLSAALFTMTLITVGCTLPSSPGFVGSIQYFSIMALSVYGIDQSLGLGFSLIYHVVEFVPLTVAGLVCLIAGGITLKEVKSQRKVNQSGEDVA